MKEKKAIPLFSHMCTLFKEMLICPSGMFGVGELFSQIGNPFLECNIQQHSFVINILIQTIWATCSLQWAPAGPVLCTANEHHHHENSLASYTSFIFSLTTDQEHVPVYTSSLEFLAKISLGFNVSHVSMSGYKSKRI